MNKKLLLLILGLAFLSVGAALILIYRAQSKGGIQVLLPPPTSYEQVKEAEKAAEVSKEADNTEVEKPLPSKEQPKPTPASAPSSVTLPGEVNLAVPFISQAPFKKWDEDHEEFCEEASLLMAESYLAGIASVAPDEAEKKLQEIKAFEMKRFGFFKDTTAEQTATILREFYKRTEVKVKYDPTLEDIKQALADGKVVILPAAGRMLGNPHFSGAGPVYHMILIKGYTRDDKIITNDPGTQFGANYLYSPEVIMRAMHDWNGGNVDAGKKVIIIVG